MNIWWNKWKITKNERNNEQFWKNKKDLITFKLYYVRFYCFLCKILYIFKNLVEIGQITIKFQNPKSFVF